MSAKGSGGRKAGDNVGGNIKDRSRNTIGETTGQKPGAELWPLLVQFVLSQKTWWISMCAELDLSPAQGHALRVLDPDRPVAMSALADELVCDASNVTGIVDKLESRGLIARQADERDRRIKMLMVTERGREVRGDLITRAMEPPPAVAALPADARRLLAQVLRAVLAERGGPPPLFR
jgi:MarR family transcriptional regulator, organic hydroperoxide resistance regulator